MLRMIPICILMLAILLAACDQSLQVQATPVPSPLVTLVPSPLATPLPPTLTSPLSAPGRSAEADAAERAAIADLVAKHKVAPETVQVVSVEATDWPDTSLGCPQPGMFYAQIIVQGYRITLAVGNQQFEYHADRKGHVVTCDQ